MHMIKKSLLSLQQGCPTYVQQAKYNPSVKFLLLGTGILPLAPAAAWLWKRQSHPTMRQLIVCLEGWFKPRP